MSARLSGNRGLARPIGITSCFYRNASMFSYLYNVSAGGIVTKNKIFGWVARKPGRRIATPVCGLVRNDPAGDREGRPYGAAGTGDGLARNGLAGSGGRVGAE